MWSEVKIGFDGSRNSLGGERGLAEQEARFRQEDTFRRLQFGAPREQPKIPKIFFQEGTK